MGVPLLEPRTLPKHPGGHRACLPHETLSRWRPLGDVMGVSRIGDLTGLDRVGIPVAMAVRPRSLSVSVSQGKGLTLDHARTSAFMEAAELWHGEGLAGRASDMSVAAALRRGAADPDLLNRTDRPLTGRAELPWIPGRDLIAGRDCLVPLELVHTELRAGGLDCGDYFLASSNGLASGNHWIEAVLSGLCEVVERDAAARWHESGAMERSARCVDLATVDDAPCRDLIRRYERAEMSVRVWDVTSPVGIPAFVCDVRGLERDASGFSRTARGGGCHPDRRVALARALTEAAQVRLTHIAGARDDLAEEAYRNDAASRAGAALLAALSAAGPPLSFRDGPTFVSAEICEDLLWCLGRLEAAGMTSCMAVDLTREEIGIPVVRVVVPGLRADPAHPGLSRGVTAQAPALPR